MKTSLIGAMENYDDILLLSFVSDRNAKLDNGPRPKFGGVVKFIKPAKTCQR